MLNESQSVGGGEMPSPSRISSGEISASPLQKKAGAKSLALAPDRKIALLTGGRDKHYSAGLALALLEEKVAFDFLGSDDVDFPEVHRSPFVRYFNLRDQRPDATLPDKIARIILYYWRLMLYAATSRAHIFHILWNNKFEFFDRTLLMLYYKLVGKQIVLTAHNVNAGARDGNDSVLNRLSLKFQYRVSDHIFVHTQKMKTELVSDFNASSEKITLVPYGINNIVPDTGLTSTAARQQLNIGRKDRVVLFFGSIAPYKGLNYLLSAFIQLAKNDASYRMIVAGKPKWDGEHWTQLQPSITGSGLRDRITENIAFIPDEQAEVYFKAADVLILPYTHIFQSGILFLGYSFGLPVIASDVGSLREEIVEGRTGFVCKPRDSSDLAATIQRYFESDLYRELASRRAEIRAHALESHSWSKVAEITCRVYSKLLRE